MQQSEEEPSENTACIPVEEYERLIFLGKINQIVATMSLQELIKTLDLIELIRK